MEARKACDIMTHLHMSDKTDGYELSVYSLLRYNATKYCKYLAFQDAEKEYNWKESMEIICKIAYQLSAKGITKDSQVLLVIDKTIESTMLLYSLLLLGCNVFITNLNTYKNTFLFTQNIDVVIGNVFNQRFNSQIKTWSVKQIWEDSLKNMDNPINYPLFDYRVDPSFIVLFTSGTLGDAKGIQLSQYSYMQNAQTYAHCLHIKHNDKYCLVTPLHHCFGIINIFSALTKAACLFFPSSNNYDDVLIDINHYKCTVLNTVPTYFMGMQKSVNFNKDNIMSIKKM